MAPTHRLLWAWALLASAQGLLPTKQQLGRGGARGGGAGAEAGRGGHGAQREMPVVSHAEVGQLHRRSGGNATSASSSSQAVQTFQSWYNMHVSGRGVWKWSNALDAYQRHLGPMAGQSLKLVEIGVQSGGSIDMWHEVLGEQCHVYGIDINQATTQFTDPLTTITIGDQADVSMWQNFFQGVSQAPIDALIDDGGHEPHQMLVTLTAAFDHLTPGGVIAIEDIHGDSYVESFFVPTAKFLGQRSTLGQVDSVHIYPYLLVAVKGGNPYRAPLTFSGSSSTVADFDKLWVALQQNAGGHVVLENPGWGPFLTEQGLINFFKVFGSLHRSSWNDYPPGCRTTANAVCTVTVTNDQLQYSVTGVHIYATRLVVELAATPVMLSATRKGSVWLPYG